MQNFSNLSSVLYDPYGRVIDTEESDLPKGIDFFYWRPQIFALSEWTSEVAYGHASAHETGDFATSSTLYRAMTQDPRVADGCNKRALALRGVRYRVSAGPGPYGALLAAKFEQILRTAAPVSNERPRLRSAQSAIEQMQLALLMGPGVQQLKWKLFSDEWNPQLPSQQGWYYPTVDPWEPDALRWNGWRYVARCITSVRGDAWLEVPIERGTGQWITFNLFGGHRPHLYSHLRTLWRPWFSRLHGMRMWLRFDDVHGLPIRLLKVPMGMRRTKEMKEFYNQVDNLGSDATLQAPQQDAGRNGVDLDLKEAVSQSWKSFVEKFRTMGAEITITLTGGTQNTEATGGNYKGAEEQKEIRHEVKGADALADCEALNEDVAVPFALLNGFPVSSAPIISLEEEIPTGTRKLVAQAQQEEGKALQQLTLAWRQLRAAGVMQPLPAFLAERGYRLPAGVVVQEPSIEVSSRGNGGSGGGQPGATGA